MKKSLRFFSVLLCVLVVPILLSSVAYATGDVTFQVNMKIQLREGKFLPGSGDGVFLAGDMNGWSTSATPMSDGNADSIYDVTVLGVTEGTAHYKFYKTLRGGLDWEHNQPTASTNREYNVVAGPQTVDAPWFNDDSVFVPPAPVPVTFQVNMRVKMLEGTFRPDLGDIVYVPGSHNGWAATAEPLADGDGDSIYTRTDTINEGTDVFYKFYKTARGGLDWENGSNREILVPFGGTTIAVDYFDHDSVINVPINANILYQVNMNAYEDLGWFRPDLGDSLELRGSINGWSGGTMMTENNFNPGIYEINLPYSGTSFDDLPYKFRMKLDSISAETRFPGFGTDQDNVGYDHPAELGDGNRHFNVGNGGDVTCGPFWFSNIDSCGEIPAGDTVTVTARVDMRSADAVTFGFLPATDSVFFYFYDRISRLNQVRIAGGFPNPLLLTDPDHDTIYTGTFDIVGPAHYNLLYYYQFKHVDNTAVTEGGGLGASNPYRSRFIAPLASKTFPRNFTLRLDQFHKNAPMPGEGLACPAPSTDYAMVDGWNMISVALTVPNYNKGVLYPAASSNAFGYAGTYTPTSTLSNGAGYWLKFTGAQNATIAGFFYTAVDVPVVSGWNMIGSVTDPVAVASISSTPGGIVNSQYFGYNGSYTIASSIDPGQGYWVRTNAAGTLHLLSTATAKVSPVNPTDKLNKLVVTDQAGHTQVLYFGADGVVDASRYAMPPMPPEGAFDARFASNLMLAVVENGKSGSFPIQVSSVTGMVKVKWELRSAAITGTLVSGTKEYSMQKNGSATVSARDLKLVLNGTANSALLPKTFALSQNYPNPFNPTTSIQYQLPADSKVTVKIYDIMGNEVRTLVDGIEEAGYKTISWNAVNNSGAAVASGVYFYRVTATSTVDAAKVFVDTKKMMLMK